MLGAGIGSIVDVDHAEAPVDLRAVLDLGLPLLAEADDLVVACDR